MPFTNEYVPPRDKERAIEFIRRVLAESRSKAEPRQFPHPLEHYSAQEHRLTEFVIDARERLRTGYSVWDLWTIDYERQMVLIHMGWWGRDIESANDCSWGFIDRKGYYQIHTTRLSHVEVSPGELAVTYKMTSSASGHGRSQPDMDSLMYFKEALDEYHRYCLFNFEAYPRRHLSLIDGRTGTEI